ncbi:glycerate kinase [Sinobaca qinghaiensis]|uniref:Glycerate kinase n=1 Tax=Sinobaca qinghaiensis TaxID=342944 RepID=A0A419V428_9BACL|nr:glycerate kinase [Sinobaca qinghaiensis]RKD73279.1 glycerate kinase [Sinobaca qinghaiensis]
MKIVIAPDSFKESMTALEAAESMKKGWKDIFGEEASVDVIPMADGGEGTTTSLSEALEASMHQIEVTSPNGEKVTAEYAVSKDGRTAVLEMAEASGIGLVDEQERNPLTATSYGTGELIQDALGKGVEKIIIGIGGSATNDGGAGMIQALGGRLLDNENQEVAAGGAALAGLHSIHLSGLDDRLKQVSISVACDVKNPLTGENGASAVYGPQKGATPDMVKTLDEALGVFADVMKRDLNADIAHIEGAGAAGGMGAGLIGCLGASLESGIDIVLKETNFYERVKGADLVVTGEGKMDSQTVYGKTPVGVAKAAHSVNKNAVVLAVCGQLGEGYEAVYEHGITAAFSMVPGPHDLQTALKNGPEYAEKISRSLALMWKASSGK